MEKPKDTLTIYLENDQACPGDTIKAIISLSMTKAFDNARVVCFAQGFEETAMTETRTVVSEKIEINELTFH